MILVIVIVITLVKDTVGLRHLHLKCRIDKQIK